MKQLRSFSNAEKTEVWAQARVSVSRTAVTKYCKLGDLKTTEVYCLPVLEATSPVNPGAGRGCALAEGSRESPSSLWLFTSLPLCSLGSSCSTVVSASDVNGHCPRV